MLLSNQGRRSSLRALLGTSPAKVRACGEPFLLHKPPPEGDYSGKRSTGNYQQQTNRTFCGPPRTLLYSKGFAEPDCSNRPLDATWLWGRIV